MRILITNDDGIHSPGLDVLARIAGQFTDDVWVVAPETDQSGLAHSLTLNDPLRLRELGERRYALRGTPTDCVIMAMRKLMEGKPDLIMSGINRGQNVADDLTYSGTVAGAIEGTMLGVPSIALSQAYQWDNGRVIPWETAEAHAPAIIRALLDFGFPDGILYNVNFPNCPPDEAEGPAVTAQGRLAHGLFIDERLDGRGNPYYWLAYRRQRQDSLPGTDLHAIQNKTISVTPIRLDLTDHEIATRLRARLKDGG